MNTIRYEYEDSNSNSSFAGCNGGDQPFLCQPDDSSLLTDSLENVEDYYPYDFHHYHIQQQPSSGDGHRDNSRNGDGQSETGHYQQHYSNDQQTSFLSALHCSQTRVSSQHQQQCEDAFWNQHISDVLSDFSPSDIKLELLTDDILPMPSTSASDTTLTSTFSAPNALSGFSNQNINKTVLFEPISSTILNKEDVISFHDYLLLESHSHVIAANVAKFNKVESVLLDEGNKENVRPSNDDCSCSFTEMPLQSHQHLNLQNRVFGEELPVEAFYDEYENQSIAGGHYRNKIEGNYVKRENDESLHVDDDSVKIRRQGPSNYTGNMKCENRNALSKDGDFDADELCDFDELMPALKDGHNQLKLKKTKNCEKNNGSSYNRQLEEPHVAGGFVKPSYSYSCLITLALKNSTTGDLTVSEIYAFLCEHFPYFRAAPSGWKNSVRHNLSLNKSFLKIEVETPGCHGRKSCLWRMNPHKVAKMDQELRKWRERAEPIILSAMKNPSDLNSIQNGTMGMPPNLRRRKILMEVVIPSTSSSASTPFQRPLQITTDSNCSGIATSQNADSSANCELSYVYHHRNTPTDITSSNLYVMKQGAVQRIGRRTPYDVDHTACGSLSSSSSSSSSSLNRSNSSSTVIFGRLNNSGESFHKAAARKLDYLLQQKAATIYNPVKELMLSQTPLSTSPSSSRYNNGGSGPVSLSSRRPSHLTPQSANSLFGNDGANMRFTKSELSSSHAIFEVCENKQQQHTGGGGINSVQYHYRQRDMETKIKCENNKEDDDNDYDKNCRRPKSDENNKISTSSRPGGTVASTVSSKLAADGGMFTGGASPLCLIENVGNRQIRRIDKDCECPKQLLHADVKGLRQLHVCKISQTQQNIIIEDNKENGDNGVLKQTKNKLRRDCDAANKGGGPHPMNATAPLSDYMNSSYDIVTSALSNNPLLRFSQSPSKPLL